MSENEYNILTELSRSSGFDIALMTTFNFEIPFFERAILGPLLANNVRKISVFIDAEEFNRSLTDVNSSGLGRKYVVNPVPMTGAFHPKIILLLGEKCARLFVGSANFTTTGLMTNNEVFNFIDYTPQKPEYLDVINDAINFFLDMNSRSYGLDDRLIKDVKDYTYYHRTAPNGHLRLLFNTRHSFLEQLRDLLPANISSVRIAVPYYDNQLSAVQQFREMFPDADISLYAQNKKASFPVAWHQAHEDLADVTPFTGFKSGKDNTRNNFYHGKVFLFESEEKSYAFYGSANCTWAALGKGSADGGNVECDFFETGDLHDFDYFFDNIETQPGDQLDCQPLAVTPLQRGNFFYKYGKIESDLELTIGFYVMKPDVKVFLANQEVPSAYHGSELIVTIPEEYTPSIPEIFDIRISYEDTTETLRAWTINLAALELTRINTASMKPLEKFSIDSDGDKYREDRYNLLNAEAMCLPEVERYLQNQAMYKQIQREKEEDPDDDEEYVVNIDIPDEYRVTYKQYQTVAQIREMFLSRFLEPTFNPFAALERAGKLPQAEESRPQSDSSRPKDIHLNGSQQADTSVILTFAPRKANTEEKRFERFVKGRVKGMMSELYSQVIDPSHYLGVAAVVIDIFEKYHRDRVDDIFDNTYTLKTTADLFVNFINAKSPCEYDRPVLINCCKLMNAILAVRTVEMDVDLKRIYDDIARYLLQTVESKFHVHATYEDFLKELEIEGILSPYSVSKLIPYIETLYGYKNLDMLKSFICERYTGAEITTKGKTLFIKVSSPEVNRHSQPDTTVLSEISKYSRHVEKLATVRIIIKSSAPPQPGKNTVARIEHTIRLDYHNWQSSTVWRNGNVWDGKGKYLEF